MLFFTTNNPVINRLNQRDLACPIRYEEGQYIVSFAIFAIPEKPEMQIFDDSDDSIDVEITFYTNADTYLFDRNTITLKLNKNHHDEQRPYADGRVKVDAYISDIITQSLLMIAVNNLPQYPDPCRNHFRARFWNQTSQTRETAKTLGISEEEIMAPKCQVAN